MAEPKKRMTSTRSGNRQSHDSLKMRSMISCSNCKSVILPHHVCANCGFYRGKKVIATKADKIVETKAKKELSDE